jgi:uracil phosphoribosyltransferase
MNNDPKTIYLSQLRDKDTERAAFRKAAHQLTHLLAYEAISHLDASSYDLQTPFAKTSGTRITYPITLVPILRSGLAMLPTFLEFFPDASIGVLGLQRDKKHGSIHEYYCNMPPLSTEHRVIMLDPMIATGSTACTALDIITQQVPSTQILFVGIISAPEGINAIKKTHPEVRLIVAGQDAHLNDKKFIVPGLGDFGDRYFGTVE